MISLHKWLSNLVETFTLYGGGGGKGGGGESQTTVQKADPWEGVQPYLKDYLQLGQQVTQNPYNFYNGDTVAGFAPEQELGFNLGTQRALAGSPTLNAANTNIAGTLQGNYLSPESNPYLQATADRALGDVQSRINSQFNNNNFGSTAHQETLQRGLGEQANALYGQNYANERGNQLQAAGLSPTLAASDYADANYLQGIGAQRQGLANQFMGNAATQFGNAANFPYEQLQRYGNVVSQGTGQGGTTTSTAPNPNQSNPIAGALGGGLTGYGIAQTIGGFNPWIGAGVGALGGLFSDERLKTDIKKVGELPSGLGVYDYKKFGKPERGVLAQEVEKVIPEAVTEHPSGYKMVKYGLLG